jgi:hypothetical protein
LAADTKTAPGVITEWLKREDFLTVEPVTHTAPYLLQAGVKP